MVLTPDLMECPSPAVPRLSELEPEPEPELLRLGESRAARMYRSPDTQRSEPPHRELQVRLHRDASGRPACAVVFSLTK